MTYVGRTTKKTLRDICFGQRRPYWTYVGRTTKKTLLDICWKDYKDKDLTGQEDDLDLTGHMLEERQRRPYWTLDICWKDDKEDLTYVGRDTLLDICWKDYKEGPYWTCWKDDKEDLTGHMLEGTKTTSTNICWKDDKEDEDICWKDYDICPYWTHVGRTKKTLLDIQRRPYIWTYVGSPMEGQRRPYWTHVGRTTKKTICWNKDDFTGHMLEGLDICWKDNKEDLTGHMLEGLTGHMLEGRQRRPYWTYVGRTTKKTLDICWKDYRPSNICWKDNFVDLTGHMLEGLQR